MTTEIEITNVALLEDERLRLTFTLSTADGEIVVSGFRYSPETDELLPPSFVGRRGGRLRTVEVHGELADRMHEEARELYAEYRICSQEDGIDE